MPSAEENKMPFMEHLGELRKRIMISLVVLLVGFLVCFEYSEFIFRWLAIPLKHDAVFSTIYPYYSFVERAGSNAELIFLAPAEAFWVHMKISFIASIILCSPVLFFEAWRFISPGLQQKERRMAVPFLLATSGLFLAGAMFCFFVILPFAMNFLLTYKTESLKASLSVERYMDFCLKFILAFGAVFELPVVIVFVTRMGLVTPKTLAQNRKYAVLGAFILAAILTPTPDAFNQTLMAGPIILLYELGILASRLLAKKPASEELAG